MEYAAVWDPNLEYIAHNIEMVPHNAVRFISKLKRRDSVTSALDPRTKYAKTSAYHNRFLPRTVRELKANINKVSSVNQ